MRSDGHVAVGGLGNDKRHAGASQFASLARQVPDVEVSPDAKVLIQEEDMLEEVDRLLSGEDDGGALHLDDHPSGVEPLLEDVELPEVELLAAEQSGFAYFG
jgi:hypothetical protein